MSNITLTPQLTYGFKDRRPDILGNSYNWDWERATTDVEFVAIHHSAGPDTQTPDDLAAFHVNTRGWGGIGYHFVIDPSGLVHYVGDIGTARANVQDKNEKVIGVCLIGDFTKDLPTDFQIIAAHELCKFLLFDLAGVFPNLKQWDSLKGHQDLQSTACPGTSWNEKSGMRDRIINRLPYDPNFDGGNNGGNVEKPCHQVEIDLFACGKELENRIQQVDRLKEEIVKNKTTYEVEIKALRESLGLPDNIIIDEWKDRYDNLYSQFDEAMKQVGILNNEIIALKSQKITKNNKLCEILSQLLTIIKTYVKR